MKFSHNGEIARCYRQLKSQGGVSLLEMLFGISLFLIAVSIGIPSLETWQSSFHRNNARNELEFVLNRARAEAIAQGARVIVSSTNAGETISVGVDQIPYDNSAVADYPLFNSPLSFHMTISFSGDIIFNSRGQLVDVDNSPTNGTISLNQSGYLFSQANIYATGYTEWM